MQLCLTLATRGWGTTLPNPLVGALVVKDNRIVGCGYHRKLGEAHAEVIALIDAGSRAQDATLYVNLEPCCCAGRTPPCVTTIVQAGIQRVVVGMIDPNPLVDGKGIDILRAHGIEVCTDVLRDEAYELNRAYCAFINRHTPYTIMKIAVSLNGKISGFKDRYITSPASRRYVHSLRSRVSGVLVGKNTVLCDDPYLTDRLVGRHDPARIIIDPDLETPGNAHMFDKGARRIVFTRNKTSEKIATLQQQGVEIYLYEETTLPLTLLLKTLGQMEIGSLLVEGGGMVFDEFYNHDLYDEIYLFMAPHHVAGGKSLTDSLLRSIVSQDVPYEMIGEDRLYHVYRNH
jgi:diaminohydroxyphosphoribosylaminopyrimidine deaminase/5-amino-6-(5-phosphoribosylamino)uracil reductase